MTTTNNSGLVLTGTVDSDFAVQLTLETAEGVQLSSAAMLAVTHNIISAAVGLQKEIIKSVLAPPPAAEEPPAPNPPEDTL